MPVTTDNSGRSSTKWEQNLPVREGAPCSKQRSKELAGMQCMAKEHPKPHGRRELARARNEVALVCRLPKVKQFWPHHCAHFPEALDRATCQSPGHRASPGTPCLTLSVLTLPWALGPAVMVTHTLEDAGIFESDVVTPYLHRVHAKGRFFFRCVLPDNQLFLVGVPWFQQWWTFHALT